MKPGADTTRPPHRREVLVAWLVSLALTFAFATLAGAVPLLQANLAALFAAVFLFLPGRMLPADGPGIERYGWTRDGAARGLRLGLILTVITLAGFVPGYHLWLTALQPALAEAVSGQNADPWELAFDPGAYRRPPERSWGRPASPEADRVYVFHEGDRVFVQWRPTEAPWRLRIDTDGALVPNRQPSARTEDPWRVEGRAPRLVNLSFATRDASELRIAADVAGEPVPADRYALGALERAPRDGWRTGDGVHLPLSPWWLFHLAMTHLLLIALPEEFFYRGYLQKRLGEGITPRVLLRLGPLAITRTNVVVSAMFAVGHLVAEPGFARLAVFFPSLLFGALRDRTDGIWASVVFHAACNLMVQVAAVHYF